MAASGCRGHANLEGQALGECPTRVYAYTRIGALVDSKPIEHCSGGSAFWGHWAPERTCTFALPSQWLHGRAFGGGEGSYQPWQWSVLVKLAAKVAGRSFRSVSLHQKSWDLSAAFVNDKSTFLEDKT